MLIARVRVDEAGDLLLVRVEGSHFLWKMVRRMVGVLVEVGRGELGAGDVARFLREPSGIPARLTAPAVRPLSRARDLPRRPAACPTDRRS